MSYTESHCRWSVLPKLWQTYAPCLLNRCLRKLISPSMPVLSGGSSTGSPSLSRHRYLPIRQSLAAIRPYGFMLAVPVSFALAVPSVVIAAPSDEANTSGAPNGATVERVVVTSQKRVQYAEDIPVSISVLNKDDLQAQKIGNFDDISRIIPGVSFNAVSAAEGQTNVTIRGVSSTSGSATVGLYLDDVSITTKNFYDFASQPKFFDLQSIEVLRGPQGSLYGASSEGGTIRFIPVAPNMTVYSGEVGAELSSTKHGSANYNGTAILNVPINPGIFAVRGSLYSSSDSGFVDNFDQQGALATKGVNHESATALHLLGKLTPGNALTITPAIFYQVANSADNAAFYPALGLFKQNKQVREYSKDTLGLASLSIVKGFDTMDLTSVTGLFHRQVNRQQDGTFYNSTLFAQAFLDPLYPTFAGQNDTLIGNLASPVKYNSDYRQFSQELRLSSPEADKSKLKWVAGLYYADQKIHNTNFQQIPGINTAFQGIYGFPMEQSLVQDTYGAPGLLLFPNDIDESDDRTYREKQIAVFGQIDYDLTPVLHVGVGGRYVKAREDFTSTEIGFYQIGNISPYNQSANFHSFTPKVTVGYDIDKNRHLYASTGEGFRLGGPTGPIVFGASSVCASDFAAIGQATQPTQFNSDKLWTTEVGTKNVLADNRLSLAASLFYTNWTDIQQQIYLPTCGYYFTANVGDAHIYGGEVEASFRPAPSLALSLTAGSESAKITKTNNPSTVAVGAHLIDVPSLTVTAGVTHTLVFGSGTKLTSRANYAWTGHSYGSYDPTNTNYDNPSYGVLNLSATLARNEYEFTLFAKNALDNHTIIQRPQINTVVEGYTVRPRTIGITGKVKF